MKTILIPTDYQPSTLSCIPALCARFRSETLNLIFIHVFKLADSVTDVVMLSRRNREHEEVGKKFFARLNKLRCKYAQFGNVKIEFLYGGTLGMYRNFIEINEVDAVVEQVDVPFKPIHRTSINPDILIKRSGLPVISTNNRTYARIKQPEDE